MHLTLHFPASPEVFWGCEPDGPFLWGAHLHPMGLSSLFSTGKLWDGLEE